MTRIFFVNKKGFTLFELLLVITVIGLTSAIVIPSLGSLKDAGIHNQLVEIMDLAMVSALKSKDGIEIIFSNEGIFFDEKLHPFPKGIEMNTKAKKYVYIDSQGFFYPGKFNLDKNDQSIELDVQVTGLQLRD